MCDSLAASDTVKRTNFLDFWGLAFWEAGLRTIVVLGTPIGEIGIVFAWARGGDTCN